MRPESDVIADMQEANRKRRQDMRRKWRARAQSLVRNIIQFGQDDASCGSWDPRDMDVFLGTAKQKRQHFLKQLEKLAKEYIP